MSERRRTVDRPRRAALDVLTAVRVDEAYANLVLPQVLRKHRLEARDAGLATELASGAIRMQGLYDAVIDACLTKPRLQPEVRDVLRLGAHQLLSMRVPDHAAISTSVDLVRATLEAAQANSVVHESGAILADELYVNAGKYYAAAHSYEIIRHLQDFTDLVVTEGTIYPILGRLTRDGLLDAEWSASESAHPRKYYRLTTAGRKRLAEMIRHWETFARKIDRLVHAAGGEDGHASE